MVYMAERDDDKCHRCDEPGDTETHRIFLVDDADPKRVYLCASCVRRIQQADNSVRSIV